MALPPPTNATDKRLYEGFALGAGAPNGRADLSGQDDEIVEGITLIECSISLSVGCVGRCRGIKACAEMYATLYFNC